MRYLNILGAAALAAATLISVSDSQAHHAFAAEFDAQKALAVRGVVTKVRFVNPHSWIYLDVKNQDGSVTNWGFEFGTPAGLANNNVTRADVAPGTEVGIQGYLAKNGGPFGYSAILTLDDGRKVRTGGAPDAPQDPRTKRG